MAWAKRYFSDHAGKRCGHHTRLLRNMERLQRDGKINQHTKMIAEGAGNCRSYCACGKVGTGIAPRRPEIYIVLQIDFFHCLCVRMNCNVHLFESRLPLFLTPAQPSPALHQLYYPTVLELKEKEERQKGRRIGKEKGRRGGRVKGGGEEIRKNGSKVRKEAKEEKEMRGISEESRTTIT